MYKVEIWPNVYEKANSLITARFLKYVFQFLNIMHEKINIKNYIMAIFLTA